MMTPMRYHPVPKQVARAGFGFERIMRHPVHGRFEAWYHQTGRLAPAHGSTA